MKRKASTIRDVAREANVSIATISHAFNDTRRKVLEAAQRLNYVPSGVARSLSTRQTNIIGAVVSDGTSPFNSMIIRGLRDRLDQNGYSLIICEMDESAERETWHLQMLLKRRVDGKEGYFQALRDHSIPTNPDLVKQIGISPEATDETIRI